MIDPYDLKLTIKQAIKEAFQEQGLIHLYCSICHKKIHDGELTYGEGVTFHVLHDLCFKELPSTGVHKD